MQIRVGVDVKIDSAAYGNKIMRDQTFWKFAATEWHRLYTPYVPRGDSGNLTDSVSITPGQIEHTQPYARYQYYGEGFHFRRDLHPMASAKWDQKAEAIQGPKLISTLQAYVNAGRINFND